jgi:uncharacterized protein Smg (DUF494 family)
MSFTEVLEELPVLTVGQRQLVVRRALELDESPLSPADEALVDERLAAHHRNPDSAVPLDKMKKRLRSRFVK